MTDSFLVATRHCNWATHGCTRRGMGRGRGRDCMLRREGERCVLGEVEVRGQDVAAILPDHSSECTDLNTLNCRGSRVLNTCGRAPGHPPKDDIQNYIGALHFCRGGSYKRSPSQTGRSSIFPNSHSSATHHVPSANTQLPIFHDPLIQRVNQCILLAAHKRDTGQHSWRATMSIPAVRPGSEGRSSSFHPAIWVLTVHQSVQQAPKHDRRMGHSRRCRSCSSQQFTYHPQPVPRGRLGPRGHPVPGTC
jgi:hypothetical protein